MAGWHRTSIASTQVVLDSANICTKYAPPAQRWKGDVAIVLSGLRDAAWKREFASLPALNLRSSKYIAQPWVLDAFLPPQFRRNEKLVGIQGLPLQSKSCIPGEEALEEKAKLAAEPDVTSPPQVIVLKETFSKTDEMTRSVSGSVPKTEFDVVEVILAEPVVAGSLAKKIEAELPESRVALLPKVAVDGANICTKYTPPAQRWKGDVAIVLSGLRDAAWRQEFASLPALNLRSSKYISQPWVLDTFLPPQARRNEKLAGVQGLPLQSTSCVPMVAIEKAASPAVELALAPTSQSLPVRLESPKVEAEVQSVEIPIPVASFSVLLAPEEHVVRRAEPTIGGGAVAPSEFSSSDVKAATISSAPAELPVAPVKAEKAKAQTQKEKQRDKKAKNKKAKSKTEASSVQLTTVTVPQAQQTLASEAPVVITSKSNIVVPASPDCVKKANFLLPKVGQIVSTPDWIAEKRGDGTLSSVNLRLSEPLSQSWYKTGGESDYAGESVLLDEQGKYRVARRCFPEVVAFEQEDVGGHDVALSPADGSVDKASYENYTPTVTAREYGLAPIRWKGLVSETLTWGRDLTPGVVNRQTKLINVQTIGVEASSYVIQPWIASIKGGLGLVTGTTHMNSALAASASRRNTVTGKGQLTLFGQSRFPFNFSYSMSDARANATGMADDTVSQFISMGQKYRPLSGYETYALNYDRTSISSNSLGAAQRGADISNTWTGSFTTRVGSHHEQPLQVDGSYSVMTPADGLRRQTITSATATHTYMPEESLLTLYSMANITDTRLSQKQVGGNHSQYIQANVRGTWQPEEEDNPLVVTGTAGFFSALNDTTDAVRKANLSNRTYSLNGTLGATYNAWADWSLSGTASLALVYAQVQGWTVSTRQTVSVAYRPKVIKLAKDISYSWNARVTATNRTTGGAADQTVTAGIGHTASMPYTLVVLDKKSNLNFNAGQQLSVSAMSAGAPSAQLTNSGGVSWSASLARGSGRGSLAGVSAGASATSTANIAVRFVDSASLTKNGIHTQSTTVTMGLGGGSGANAAGYGATAGVTFQVNKQKGGGLATKASGMFGYAYDYKYTKQRIFGVRGLNYALALRVGAALRTDESGVPNIVSRSSNQSTNYSLSQNLLYRIGQNEVRLTAGIGAQDGRKTAMLLLQLRAWRNFGN